ncbi:ABC transporter permease [Neptunomonas antarctica]|uniref:Amino acid ABC transporter membrane protein 1, PAAT family n=1 Tax=Neptunomonas antarctica TaxID=619304 RepID=A0A1N7IYC6_9GAMM|nr:ABC transporter permease [Neptunomonas antarctica]SIS41996.1 amino acid ABC transporter membrane protein 1, PAAT family [Neptunomonas antarctica]
MIDLHGFGHLLLAGTWVTVKLALVSLFFGLIFGLLGASAKLSKYKFLRWMATGYTTIVRGIPELLIVFAIYFGGSALLMSVASLFGYEDYIEVNPFMAGVAALSIAFGAYATEVFRMAILSIPQGQWESAQALGMTPAKTFSRIILPQVWRVALPGLGNLFQVLMKDTALVSVVGLQDIIRQASTAVSSTNEPFTFYLAAACIYLVLTAFATAGTLWMERACTPQARYKG